jgi:hypothetical protein
MNSHLIALELYVRSVTCPSLQVYALNAGPMLTPCGSSERQYNANRASPSDILSQLVDKEVDRLHIIGVKLVLGLVFCRHFGEDGIQTGLEVANERRKSAGSLLADFLIGIFRCQSNKGGNRVEYQKL